jgi:hypothetical protein
VSLGGAVLDFTVSFWASVTPTLPFQPDLGNFYGGRLAEYILGENAGETPAGTTMYDYQFTLPAALP